MTRTRHSFRSLSVLCCLCLPLLCLSFSGCGKGAVDADGREAADMVFRLGGTVTAVGANVTAKMPADLPVSGFAVDHINLSGTAVRNQDLEVLAGLNRLRTLDLAETKIGDRGLEHIGGLRTLRKLNLNQTQVTDKGLDHLTGLTNLQELHLYKTTGITDQGLDHIGALTSLQILELSYTQVSDAGLEKLYRLKRLKKLYLHGTTVSDEGLEALRKNLKKTQILR